MVLLRYAIILFFLMSTYTLACDQRLVFSPKNGVDIEAYTKAQILFYKISASKKTESHQVGFDTEKKINLTIEDFNFDGHLDMSVSHIDDGMGNFTISRVFIFSTVNEDFYEIFPDCGEQFLNLKIDAESRKLVSSYFEDNIPALCETRIGKRK